MLRTRLTLFTAILTFLTVVSASAQELSRDTIKKQIETKRAELAGLEEQLLSPSASDRADFAAFLTQPGTGLIRLLPRETYDGDVNTKNKTLTMRGGGAYYSFVRGTHEYGFGSDIELSRNELSVGFAGADYGMLLKLGDIALEDISLDLPAVRTVLEYKVPTNEPDARAEYRKFANGADLAGFAFTSRLPLQTDTTYLLRSINYGDSDVAVVFRVVRRDTDGSAILAFKVLKKFTVPKLAQN